MKHGFKPKLKRTFLTKGCPWWFTSHQFKQECGSSLPLSWVKMAIWSIIMYVTHSLPLLAHNLSLEATEKIQGDL